MIAEVIVDIAANEINRVFDYAVSDNVKVGMRVAVPFGNKKIEGFVIGLKETTEVPDGKLKTVTEPLDDFTAITGEMLELLRFMRKKYHLNYIDVLRLFIPSKMRGGRVSDIMLSFATLKGDYGKIVEEIGTRAKKQLECVEHLKNEGDFTAALNKNFGASAVNALKEKGFLEIAEVHHRRSPFAVVSAEKTIKLNVDQQRAVEAINSGKGTFLLHGVTGSGKTEVYMHCIEEALLKGKTAIMLVPEISLTPQVLGLFRGRFGEKVAILHSALSDGERFDEWKRLLTGEAKIAVGARSAIFAPLQNLGIIIVDEEHDGSYISESNPRYDTKEVAEYRAKFNGCPLILGSATPQIESYYRAEHNEYTLLELPNRIYNKNLPEIEIVDMSMELRRGNRDIFSNPLKEGLKQVVEKGEQAIIFLNRRGYSSFLLCKECGYIPKCEDCDISLTYHKADNRLKCHYCGKTYGMLGKCPKCGSENIRYGRVGTEQVVDEIIKLIPNARVLRMDNDTTTKKGSHQEILQAFTGGGYDILVGTQMIAKGHDFKNVTLVGILDADFSLYFSDYRSNERTFQLITQVAGRAGREEKGGRVLLQTYSPKHPILYYASRYDYQGFYGKEINSREVAKFPPFTKIVRVLITATDECVAQDAARLLNNRMKEVLDKNKADFIYYKGMKSPVARVENRYRYQLLMRILSDRADEIINEIYKAVDETPAKTAWVFVEINPQNLT